MEFWPADFRADSGTVPKKKRKDKESFRLNDQAVQQGSLGAATLTIGGSQPPQWLTVVEPCSKSRINCTGQPTNVFPATRPPPPKVPQVSVHQRAEQGARYLRTHHPDTDISFEVIKGGLRSEEEENNAYDVLDPFAGNCLAYLIWPYKRRYARSLAFACGETGSGLNISPFRVSRSGGTVFAPSASPVLNFDTPIQQISPFYQTENQTETYALLAIRNNAAINIVKVESSSDDIGAISAAKVAGILSSATGNYRIVDIACGSQKAATTDFLMVNRRGIVYECKIRDTAKVLSVISDVPILDGSERESFWRISLSHTKKDSFARTSGKKAYLFDSRCRQGSPREIFKLTGSNEHITSVEASTGVDHTICFATTSKLLWYDDRNIKQPLFSFLHKRAHDRTLQLQCVTAGSITCTCLSSRRNQLVTVYDVARAPFGHIQLQGLPSMLPLDSSLELPIMGSLLFADPIGNKGSFSHFQLSSRGSLWKTDVSISDTPSPNDSRIDFEWDERVQALAENAEAMKEDIGPQGEREYVEANLRNLYLKIFDVKQESTNSVEDPEAVYATLDQMPFFWQDMNAPVDHMLATFDIAFQSGTEPTHASRADFLTGSLLNSSRGATALRTGRIPIPRLTAGSKWHMDISALPSHMVPDVKEPSQALVNQLSAKTIADATDPLARISATQAAENLTLDLALSRHVYAPQGFTKPFSGASKLFSRSTEELSDATQAMSLNATEPPPVQFGFLNPIEKIPYGDEERMEGYEEPLAMSLGIRLLLSGWELGADLHNYVYKDPYQDDRDGSPAESRKASQSTAPAAHASQAMSQPASIPPIITVARPPVVVASTVRPNALRQFPAERLASLQERGSSPIRRVGFAQSQRDAEESQDFAESQSQSVYGPSTQPLPGPFGGQIKQAGTKKKVAKKRMGGF